MHIPPFKVLLVYGVKWTPPSIMSTPRVISTPHFSTRLTAFFHINEGLKSQSSSSATHCPTERSTTLLRPFRTSGTCQLVKRERPRKYQAAERAECYPYLLYLYTVTWINVWQITSFQSRTWDKGVLFTPQRCPHTDLEEEGSAGQFPVCVFREYTEEEERQVKELTGRGILTSVDMQNQSGRIAQEPNHPQRGWSGMYVCKKKMSTFWRRGKNTYALTGSSALTASGSGSFNLCIQIGQEKKRGRGIWEVQIVSDATLKKMAVGFYGNLPAGWVASKEV